VMYKIFQISIKVTFGSVDCREKNQYFYDANYEENKGYALIYYILTKK